MDISVIGCGYLGAVHAAAMASIGRDVVGIDIDEEKIDSLSRRDAPFFEPGLQEILTAGVESGRLRFSTDMAEAAGATVHFLTVGTPQQKDGRAADLVFVDAAVDALVPFLARATSSPASRRCPWELPPNSPLGWKPRGRRSCGTRSICARAS